jgi:hypothetical protein
MWARAAIRPAFSPEDDDRGNPIALFDCLCVKTRPLCMRAPCCAANGLSSEMRKSERIERVWNRVLNASILSEPLRWADRKDCPLRHSASAHSETASGPVALSLTINRSDGSGDELHAIPETSVSKTTPTSERKQRIPNEYCGPNKNERAERVVTGGKNTQQVYQRLRLGSGFCVSPGSNRDPVQGSTESALLPDVLYLPTPTVEWGMIGQSALVDESGWCEVFRP